MDMHTTVLLVRTLMLGGMILPLVVEGVVLAVRDGYRDSKAPLRRVDKLRASVR
jgi:hypothetical protein